MRQTQGGCTSAGYNPGSSPCGRGWSATYWEASTKSAGAYTHQCLYPKNGHTEYVTYTPPSPEPVDAGTVGSTFQSDFATDASNARRSGVDLLTYLGNLVSTANRAWPGTVPDVSGYSPMTEAQGDTVQEAFNDALDPQAKAELQDIADANGTSAPPGSNQGGQNDWEYTPEQMATAQKTADLEREATWVTDWTAEKPADGNDSTAAPGTYTLPERRDLPGVLDTFKNGIAALPLVSWASGFEISVTGASSIIELPIPQAWGNAITVDFADYENVLDAMGNGLYALVGIASMLFLFRGRGD